jgi:hypothetical protein
MALVILLPITLFLVLFMLLLGSRGSSVPASHPWQGNYLLVITLWGACLILLSEGLSIVRGLSRWPIAAGWLLALIVVLAVGVRSGSYRRGYQAAVSGLRSLSRQETGLLVAIASLSLLLFAVAVVTPTNNVDSMDYHMPRVMEWAQNRSLAHFPTMHESQNIRPYWAEAVILHLRVLWGNDQPAGLAQWFIMLSSVIAASGIAALLGGDRRAQWLAAVVAFSIPMGLLQSSTTQNDYIAAFWVVCLAYFVILSRKRELSRLEFLGLGLSLGLGMLTKGTFFPFAGPLMLWFFLGRIADKQIRKSVVEGLVVLLMVLVVNGLFWARNIGSTGGPYGSRNPLNMILNLLPGRSEILQPPQPDEALLSGEPSSDWHPDDDWVASQDQTSSIHFLGAGLPAKVETDPRLTQLARMVAMNFVSPFNAFNQAYFRALRARPQVFSEAWVRNLEGAAWNHEDSAGSPVHFILIVFSMAFVAYVSARGQLKHGLVYALVLTASFVLLSLIGFSGHVFGIRYQLGFFILGAPLVGLVFTRPSKIGLALAGLFLVYSLPYVLLSNMRPVIGHKPWPTRVPSVFTARGNELLFAINPEDEQRLVQVADQITAVHCDKVGLSYSRNNLEYQLWYLLGAPESGIEIQHLTSLPEFSEYLKPDYQPCAVVCTLCDALPEQYRLPQSYDFGDVRLYLDPGS